jgi:hypothetical protein
MAFIRRFTGFFPGLDVIKQIEGIAIVALEPPGDIIGVGTGTTAIVGEFADVTYGVTVDESGNVSTHVQPVEIFSPTDLVTKTGGFDETIGEFGGADGNGFVAVRNNKYSRLIAVVVNNASSKGVRAWRHLPSNAGDTDPTPVVSMQAATVLAGREFKSGGDRARLCQAVGFTADGAYASGVDGALASSSGATAVLTSAGAAFLTANDGKGVQVGDIVVLGSLAGSGDNLTAAQQGSTFRVEAVTDDNTLVLEKMDGTNFSNGALASLAYRIHVAATADSGGQGHNLASAGGYLIPARPLDATIAHDTVVAPSLVPSAETATSWDPLSGLSMATQPGTGNDLAYTAAVQAPNAANASEIDALYSDCFDALLGEELPAREVNIVFAARTSQNIRSFIKQHVLDASASGVGRRGIISPPIDTIGTSGETTVLGDSDPGVGANRDARLVYGWPGYQTFIKEAVGFPLLCADGKLTGSDQKHVDGVLDKRIDGKLASIFSILAPERNPGQAAAPIPQLMADVLGIQRGVTGLGMPDYIRFRARGIMALRIDRSEGPVIQSGVTTSLNPKLKNYARQAMEDFLTDSVSEALAPYEKLPLTEDLMDTELSEVKGFLEGLLSRDEPTKRRIAGYTLTEDRSLSGDGVYIISMSVRNLASQDDLVLQATVGENVETTVTAVAA